MATTEILPFGSGGTGTSNVLTQADYVTFLAALAGNSYGDGNMPSAKQLNKILRQSSFLAAGLAKFMVNRGISVPDDGNLDALVAKLESASNAYIDKSVAGNVDVTLSSTLEANYPIIDLVGALTGNINVIFPQAPGKWIIKNSTTGAYAITLKMATGTSIVVAQGAATPVYSDGTDMMYGISVVDQAEAEAGTATALRGWSPERVKQSVEANSMAHGQCRLSVASATSLTLAPYNGNGLIIGGIRRKFASAAGVTISNAGLSANTVYYAYATWSGSAIVLNLSTTGHAMLDSGVEAKSTDALSTLVGMIRTNASSQFVDSIAQRFCINWFNRKSLGGNQGFLANRTTSSAALVEISSSERLEFLAWAFDTTYLASPVNISQNNIGPFASSLYVDGGAYSNQVVTPPAIGALVFLCPQYPYSSATDGYHYASVYGAAVSGFTATWQLSTTVLTAQIWG